MKSLAYSHYYTLTCSSTIYYYYNKMQKEIFYLFSYILDV